MLPIVKIMVVASIQPPVSAVVLHPRIQSLNWLQQQSTPIVLWLVYQNQLVSNHCARWMSTKNVPASVPQKQKTSAMLLEKVNPKHRLAVNVANAKTKIQPIVVSLRNDVHFFTRYWSLINVTPLPFVFFSIFVRSSPNFWFRNLPMQVSFRRSIDVPDR